MCVSKNMRACEVQSIYYFGVIKRLILAARERHDLESISREREREMSRRPDRQN